MVGGSEGIGLQLFSSLENSKRKKKYMVGIFLVLIKKEVREWL